VNAHRLEHLTVADERYRRARALLVDLLAELRAAIDHDEQPTDLPRRDDR